MKLKLFPAIAATTLALSSFAQAASVDFRHEYKSERKEHSSRVKVGHTFENNLSLDMEVKFKSEDPTEFMKNLVSNGYEIGINYKHKINNEWAIIPGMPIEISSDGKKYTYKPQLRLTYTPEAVKGLSLSGRYRLDVKPHETVKKHRHRYTVNVGYKINRWNFGYEGNYYYSDNPDYHLYNNKRTNYEHNLTAGYKIGAWTPWVEVGDINVNNYTDKREIRTRVGIRYSF